MHECERIENSASSETVRDKFRARSMISEQYAANFAFDFGRFSKAFELTITIKVLCTP